MSQILVRATLDIQPGKMDELKKVAAACIERVQEKDTGTLQYDWFYNDEKNQCIVIERYNDSDALLEHVANVGELLGAIAALSSIGLEIYGDASPTLRNAVAGFGPTFYEYGAGL